MVEGHGDDGYKYAHKVLHNFSSNVYYKGCDPRLLAELQDKIGVVKNYPSPMANELNQVAANYFNKDVHQFLFGNGATELFYLIAQCFSGTSATVVVPTFSEYQDACEMYQLKTELTTWQQVLDYPYKTALAFICNPNNPTGEVLQVQEIEILLKKYPKTTFVIDEAYIEFCAQTDSAISLLDVYQNIILVKSLTKTFAIPGLRLGYVIASQNIIKKMLVFKQPWTVNALAITAGTYIFKNYQNLLFSKKEMLAKTVDFAAKINEIPFLEVQKNSTSYFLIKVLKGTATALKEYLMQHHQILVRDATNFKQLQGEYIRVSLQNTLSNQTLIKALKIWSVL